MSNVEKEYVEHALFESDLKTKIANLIEFPGGGMQLLTHREFNKFNPNAYNFLLSKFPKQGYDNSMIGDDIYYLTTDTRNRMYYLDCSIGLIYVVIDGVFSIAINSCYSSEYDIFDAMFLRHYLIDPNFRCRYPKYFSWYSEITSLDYLGHKVEDIFSIPIPEYTVSSMLELKSIIRDIEKVISESKFFRKLWYRGQRREYTVKRSIKTLNKIGFPVDYSKVPSLIPSLGRANDKNIDYKSIMLSNEHWLMAFRIWVSSQNPYSSPYSRFDTSMYKKLIENFDTKNMIALMEDSIHSGNLLCEDIFDDLKECSNGYYDDMGVLAMQQYGGLTSGLDITDDLDVAIFFTQSFLNAKTNQFELCEPQDGNVIYLMAQCKETNTLNLPTDMFGASQDIPIPTRISQQKCGLQTGANIFAKNIYAHRIIAKISLKGSDILTTKSISDMFPGMESDTLYRNFAYAKPDLEGLYGSN